MMAIIGYAMLACVLTLGGSGVWSLLFHLNLRFEPGVPWSAGLMLALIGGSWCAFARTRGFRGPLPSPALRGWALVAALCLGLTQK
jgi:hypothetical protein